MIVAQRVSVFVAVQSACVDADERSFCDVVTGLDSPAFERRAEQHHLDGNWLLNDPVQATIGARATGMTLVDAGVDMMEESLPFVRDFVVFKTSVTIRELESSNCQLKTSAL